VANRASSKSRIENRGRRGDVAVIEFEAFFL